MALSCLSCSFQVPSLPGAQITAFDVNLVENHTQTAYSQLYYGHATVEVVNATFCNVTISYTHEDEDDDIKVETWLPVGNYNGRLQAIGGGGWVAGRYPPVYTAMSGALGEGYATTTTDAGLLQQEGLGPDRWALNEDGEPNYNALRNLGYVSLNDQYSYWSGCSQGGRQGMMLAQRYPDAYDGIHACAPAIHWSELFAYTMWPQLVMNWIDYFPYPCELAQLVEEATSACDELDGVQDGIITDDSACRFDPMSVVGVSFYCSDTNTTRTISQEAAMVAKATWEGPRTEDGLRVWYGSNTGSKLSGSTAELTNDIGPAMTSCSGNSTCVGVPLGLGTTWIKYFVEADPSWDYSTMTQKQFESSVIDSKEKYDEIIGTNDPDLTSFYNRGGKILGYHGMADQIIPVKGIEHYYDRVTEIIPQVHDFYRMFEVPGLLHCSGGPGGQPINTFDALRSWVENGTVPDVLSHSYTPVEGGPELHRQLCPYPRKVVDGNCAL